MNRQVHGGRERSGALFEVQPSRGLSITYHFREFIPPPPPAICSVRAEYKRNLWRWGGERFTLLQGWAKNNEDRWGNLYVLKVSWNLSDTLTQLFLGT